MKKIILGLMMAIMVGSAWGKVLDVLQADFTGTKVDNVYQIVSKLGCHTTIELPQGKRIKHFIIGDQKLWKAESDGKYAFIKPISTGIETTITVITTDEKMYQFTATEGSAIGETDFHKKVKIICEDEEPMIKPVSKQVQEKTETADEIRQQIQKEYQTSKVEMIKSLDNKFKIKKNKFNILNVYQDGVFTFIDLSKTQIRPAVFLVNEKDKKKLEPVNFTDEDGIFTVHRILANDEFFLLKHGKNYSKIIKK